MFESLLCYLCLLFTLDYPMTVDSFPKSELELLVNYSRIDPPYAYYPEFGDMGTPSLAALELFFALYKICVKSFPYFKSDGLGNVWVVKASESSRGRNIFLLEDLEDAKQYDNGTRLVQKYIENVWIFRENQISEDRMSRHPYMRKLVNRKFDIRIWVLVTSFAPLSVFIYKEGYLRVSQESYQLHDLDSRKTHLTNFSVNWKQERARHEDSYVLLSDFSHFLQEQQLCSVDNLNW